MDYLYPIIFSIVTFLSTFLGGAFAMKFKSKIYLIMAFAAGVLMGVVCFDIFPEIFEQVKLGNASPLAIMSALIIGFLLFHVLEKTILIHHAHEDEYATHSHPHVGVLSALALAGHSFMDGASIGIGYQVSPALGLIIAIAVISHDFCDGMNTVALMISHGNSPKKARRLLILDALAPVAGLAFSFLFQFSEQFLALYLGFFAGFILYIGASDILPEAHSKQSSLKLIGLTVLGVIFIFIITRFA